jgi:osmotically-inducible protein OsmY
MKKDAHLQQDVLDELQWEPAVEATQIGVTVKDGIVTLTGEVSVFAEKFEAEKAAKRVHGVKGVANEIEVRPPGTRQRTDADIAAAAVSALHWNATVPDESVQVTVRDGWITLEGTLEQQHQKAAADEAVRKLIGARGVTNLIVVKPKASRGNVKALIEAAFRRSAELDSKRIQVETRNGKVILRGTLHSLGEREEAERAARAAPGVLEVENLIQVTPWEEV